MRYVITGASGHIGNNLVRFINGISPNDEIKVLARRHIDRELTGAVCEQVEGDLFSRDFLLDNIDSDSVVIHLAGFIDLTDKMADETFHVNRDLTRLILEVCRERNNRFIYVGSTDAIYRESEVISEPQVYYPDKIEGNYGRSKAEASALVLDAINNGLSGAVVIPSAVIGINDFKPSAVGKIIRGVMQGRAEIGIEGGYNFVDVCDVCRAIYTLASNSLCGQWIVSGESVGVSELFGMLNSVLGIKRKIHIMPTWIVRIFLPFIPSLNKITLKALLEAHTFSNEKARRELGITPTPFAVTLKNTVEWFENDSNIK